MNDITYPARKGATASRTGASVLQWPHLRNIKKVNKMCVY